jgi:hypothetical protein
MVGTSLEAIVGRSEASVVGILVGPVDGAVVVAPNAVGSILTVGKSVGAFEGRNVGLDVVCEGVGLGRSVRASDGAEVGLKLGFSIVGASFGKESDGVGSGDFEGAFVGAADSCELGNIDGSAVGFKSDGLELTEGFALGCRLADASVGSLLTVTVGPGE